MTRLENLGPDPVSGRTRWSLSLLPLEAGIVASLPQQLEALLADPDSNRRVIDRLFPPSYADPSEQAQHRQMLGDGLLAERRAMLADVASQLAGATRNDRGMSISLDAGSMDLWLRFLNDVRLVLATDLGIETSLDETLELDPADPDAPKYALLEYLGGLEALLVDALSREI